MPLNSPSPQPPAAGGATTRTQTANNKTRSTRKPAAASVVPTATTTTTSLSKKPLSSAAEPFVPPPTTPAAAAATTTASQPTPSNKPRRKPAARTPPVPPPAPPAIAATANNKQEEKQTAKTAVAPSDRNNKNNKKKKKTPPPPPAEETTNTPALPKPVPAVRKPPAPASIKRWWASLRDVDPITLQPLRHLKVEPFELSVSDSTVKHFFDCESLATYLLQTGKFLDPINRQPISRAECLRLDSHLKRFGLQRLARCVEMMDLQNSTSVSSSSAAQGGDRRREQVLLASSLFQYAPMVDQPQQQQQTGGRRGGGGVGGGMRVMDDDEDPFLHAASSAAGGGVQLVEDDFPEMPLVRRRATVDDFPLMASSAARRTTTTCCSSCTLENVVGATVCAACGQALSSSAAIPAPVQSALWRSGAGVVREAPPTVSLESWRRKKAQEAATAGDVDDSARPRLVLVSCKGGAGGEGSSSAPARSEALFGKAKPINFALPSSSSSDTNNHNHDSDGHDEDAPALCPFHPKLVKTAASLGFTFVQQMERAFKTLIESGNTRTSLSLEPMSEPKRYFLHELAARYYGLQCVERDPEPKRFLQLSNTPASFVPDFTLTRTLLVFPGSRFDLEAPKSSAGILLVGVSLSAVQLSQGLLVRELKLRESEFDLFWLESLVGSGGEEQRVCFISIAAVERARKTCKRLAQLNHGGASFCQRVSYWACGMDWAKVQIRALNMARKPSSSSASGAGEKKKDGWTADAPERWEVAEFALQVLTTTGEGGGGGRVSAADMGLRIAQRFELKFSDMGFPERTLTQFLLTEAGGSIARDGEDFALLSALPKEDDEEEESSDDEEEEEE